MNQDLLIIGGHLGSAMLASGASGLERTYHARPAGMSPTGD